MTIDPAALQSFRFDPIRFQVTAREAILYGLSLGLGERPADPQHLRHVYEKGLVPFPTMPVILGSPGMWFARAGLDAARIVHASQDLEIEAVLPLDTPMVATNAVTGLADRGAGKGALVEITRLITTDAGIPVARIVSRYLCRGDGGFSGAGAVTARSAAEVRGGGGKVAKRTAPPGERRPDLVCQIPVLPQAALIYRLNGDMNPLHADPAFAERLGFDRPILHGLCTFGVTARALADSLCGGDAGLLRAISARMTRPVYPGEVLDVMIYKTDDDPVFEARVAARDTTVIADGMARIGEQA